MDSTTGGNGLNKIYKLIFEIKKIRRNLFFFGLKYLESVVIQFYQPFTAPPLKISSAFLATSSDW